MSRKNYYSNNEDKLKELEKPFVFRDSIYGYIYFEYEFLKKLIDTECMQRLRRIRQLSCVNIVFHGAEHSRFTHSLGVYELARRFLEINTQVPEVQNIFASKVSGVYEDLKRRKRNKFLLLTAALLHDIGHGAYSHIFEDIFKTKHALFSAQIILNNKEISVILDQFHDKDFKKDLSFILNPTLEQNNSISKDLEIIRKLISSQLDFDRLDYLVRDAFYTGVIYGYIDTDKLIRSINITDKKEIYFSSSSVTAIENYFINYYHMYKQVYGHQKVLLYNFILKQIFCRIKDLLQENYQFKFANILQSLKYFLQEKEKLEKNKSNYFSEEYINFYLAIDDFYLNGLIIHLQNEKDNVLKCLCYDFLNRRIRLYLKKDIKKELEAKMNKKDIEKRFLKYFNFKNENLSTNYKQNLPEYAVKICEEVLIVDKLGGKFRKLSEKSPLLKSIIGSKEIFND